MQESFFGRQDLLFLDEFKVYLNEFPHYGWAKSDQQIALPVPKNKGLPTMVIATMSLAGVHYKIYGLERQQQAPATEYGPDDQHRFDRKLRRLNMEQTTVARMKEILRENEIATVGDRAEVQDRLQKYIEQQSRNGLPMLKGRGRPNVGGPILPVMNTVECTTAYIHEMVQALHPR